MAKRGRPPKKQTQETVMGRETLLTPEVQDSICGYLELGGTFKDACLASGIAENTGKEWLARGRGTDKDRDQTELYANFATSIEKAQAKARMIRISNIRKVARGYVEEIETEDGKKVKISRPPQWQADAWWLERMDREHFGRVIQGQITVNWQAELEKQGVSASEIFEQIVAMLASADVSDSETTD